MRYRSSSHVLRGRISGPWPDQLHFPPGHSLINASVGSDPCCLQAPLAILVLFLLVLLSPSRSLQLSQFDHMCADFDLTGHLIRTPPTDLGPKKKKGGYRQMSSTDVRTRRANFGSASHEVGLTAIVSSRCLIHRHF